MREKFAIIWSSLLLFTLMPPIEAKKGGFSIGRTMGRAPTNRGVFGGGNARGRMPAAPPPYSRNPPRYGQNTGYRQPPPPGWNTNGMGRNNGPGYNNPRGGLFSGQRNGGWMGGGSRGHRYSSGSGIGSKLRSNAFKNAIVGAAAGYLTYQAGRAIIRAAAGPMMWNNRPYYWGSNYYPRRSPQSNVCRMPIDQADQQFGNVYFEDSSRPREIVWGCDYYEYCCGYECCRGGGASQWRPTTGQSIGQIQRPRGMITTSPSPGEAYSTSQNY